MAATRTFALIRESTPGFQAARGRGMSSRGGRISILCTVAIAILCGLPAFPDAARADCIDYAAYLHWAGRLDTPDIA